MGAQSGTGSAPLFPPSQASPDPRDPTRAYPKLLFQANVVLAPDFHFLSVLRLPGAYVISRYLALKDRDWPGLAYGQFRLRILFPSSVPGINGFPYWPEGQHPVHVAVELLSHRCRVKFSLETRQLDVILDRIDMRRLRRVIKRMMVHQGLTKFQLHHQSSHTPRPPNGLQAQCAALIPRLAFAWRFIGGYLTQAHYSLQLWNSDGKYQNPALHAEDSLTNVLTDPFQWH